MKVDKSRNPGGARARVRHGSTTAQQKPVADRPTPAREAKDRLHLSPRAKVLAQARRQLEALPDVDMEKVREIQRRRKSGRYRLNADKIAERMIQDALNHQE